MPTKTYLDDAERLYGRKEKWATEYRDDPVLKGKLVAILRDFLKDTISATRLEAKTIDKLKKRCDREAEMLKAATTNQAALLQWARNTASEGTPTREAKDAYDDYPPSSSLLTGSNSPPEVVTHKEAVEEEASLDGTPAMDGEVFQKDSPSSFPFLRRRAVENESSLDPSLVDWTLQHFPEDDKGSFADSPCVRHPEGGEKAMAAAEDGAAQPRKAVRPPHARERLAQSLRSHENMQRPTFDAEGVYYHVQPAGGDIDDSVAKPKPVKGSDAFLTHRTDVVKVPWEVVTTAKKPGYTHNILRAKERLQRLSRGEDPATIP